MSNKRSRQAATETAWIPNPTELLRHPTLCRFFLSTIPMIGLARGIFTVFRGGADCALFPLGDPV